MIRIDRIWLAVDPMDMRAGLDTTLAGIGVWLAARRLNQGKFVWPAPGGTHLTLTGEQVSALVLGLPWQRLGDAGVIDCL